MTKSAEDVFSHIDEVSSLENFTHFVRLYLGDAYLQHLDVDDEQEGQMSTEDLEQTDGDD